MTTYGSLFSGIGGFDLGFDRSGMLCRWQVEKDRAAARVLSRHWPRVTRHDDVQEVTGIEPVDVICGGFPCQDVSVAGRRAGLAGERSGLWFEFRRIVDELKPSWVVIENVPGLLSSNGGRDFATVVRGLVECGYGVAWRVLDSQYFGVPQRRRRVFIVGYLGDGRAAQVLFEPEGGRRNTASVRAEGESLTARPASGVETDCEYVAIGPDIVPAITSKWSKGSGGPAGDETQNLTWASRQPTALYYSHDFNQDRIYSADGIAPAVTSNDSNRSRNVFIDDVYAIRSATVPTVRRLTPTECERLQGFPDGWTDGQSDGLRYRQLGNAVTVNVAEWIGKRIMEAA